MSLSPFDSFQSRFVTYLLNFPCTASGIVTLIKWPSGAPDGHLQRMTIPDAVLIQFDLLMMSTTLLETRRGLL